VDGTELADLCEAVEDASQNGGIDLLLNLAGPIPVALETFERSLKRLLGSEEAASPFTGLKHWGNNENRHTLVPIEA
jgi:hypothetical protein